MDESISYIDKIKLDDIYYILETNSHELNIEILSELKNFSSSKDFLNHFIYKGANVFYNQMNIFISEISSLITQNNSNYFNSKVEKYISDFSTIYLFFNIIQKVNYYFQEIITIAKSKLVKLYEKYQLDNNFQEKINKYIEEISYFSYNKKYSNYPLEKKNIGVEKSIAKDILEEDKNNNEEKEKTNVIENTPSFTIENINPSVCNKLNENGINKEQQNNESEIQLVKKISKESEFTFSNNIDILNKKPKSDNKPSNNIEDYITNIKQEDFIIKHPKKRKTAYVKKFNSNLHINKVNSVDKLNFKVLSHNNLNVFTNNNLKITSNNNKENTFKLNNLENHEIYKDIYKSSGHLFLREESKKYAELLEIIIELYKNDKISLEQKLKLKRLVISKSSKILKVYNHHFNCDKETFLFELKKLIL